jgi:acetoacetyl-CoA synthetase
MSDTPLWSPSQEKVAQSNLTAFAAKAERIAGRPLSDYAGLHRWSIEERGAFWSLVWDEFGVIGEKGGRDLVDGDRMPGARFFPDATLNFAENLLRKTGADDAIVFRGEDKVEKRLSWDELHALVSRLQQALTAAGVRAGDRVAAMLPNMPEAVAAMLAVTSLGAVWSSCSPDFGERGVLDRFGQIEPTVFFAVDGYWYNGKPVDVSEKVAAVASQLPGVRKTIVVDIWARLMPWRRRRRAESRWRPRSGLSPRSP